MDNEAIAVPKRFDLDFRIAPRILDRIRKQVRQDLINRAGVRLDRLCGVACRKRNAVVLRNLPLANADVRKDFSDIAWLGLHCDLAFLESGGGRGALHQPHHALARAQDLIDAALDIAGHFILQLGVSASGQSSR